MSVVGHHFQHKKTGHIYVITCIAIQESTLTPVVVYQQVDPDKMSNPIWTRPVYEFFDGRFKAFKD